MSESKRFWIALVIGGVVGGSLFVATQFLAAAIAATYSSHDAGVTARYVTSIVGGLLAGIVGQVTFGRVRDW